MANSKGYMDNYRAMGTLLLGTVRYYNVNAEPIQSCVELVDVAE